MSGKKRQYKKNSNRKIRVVGEQRELPDAQRLSRALLARFRELQAAQAESEAASDHAGRPEPLQRTNLDDSEKRP